MQTVEGPRESGVLSNQKSKIPPYTEKDRHCERVAREAALRQQIREINRDLQEHNRRLEPYRWAETRKFLTRRLLWATSGIGLGFTAFNQIENFIRKDTGPALFTLGVVTAAAYCITRAFRRREP